jgi:hypothetical protein
LAPADVPTELDLALVIIRQWAKAKLIKHQGRSVDTYIALGLTAVDVDEALEHVTLGMVTKFEPDESFPRERRVVVMRLRLTVGDLYAKVSLCVPGNHRVVLLSCKRWGS